MQNASHELSLKSQNNSSGTLLQILLMTDCTFLPTVYTLQLARTLNRTALGLHHFVFSCRAPTIMAQHPSHLQNVRLSPEVIDDECDRVLSWTKDDGQRLDSLSDYTIALCRSLLELGYEAYPTTEMRCEVIELPDIYDMHFRDVRSTIRAALGSKAVSQYPLTPWLGVQCIRMHAKK